MAGKTRYLRRNGTGPAQRDKVYARVPCEIRGLLAGTAAGATLSPQGRTKVPLSETRANHTHASRPQTDLASSQNRPQINAKFVSPPLSLISHQPLQEKISPA